MTYTICVREHGFGPHCATCPSKTDFDLLKGYNNDSLIDILFKAEHN